MNQLNNTQKILTISGLVIFLIIIVSSFIVALPSFKINAVKKFFLPQPIEVLDKGVNQSYYYGDDVLVEQGPLSLSAPDVSLVSAKGVDITFKDFSNLSINQAIAFIKTSSDLTITIKASDAIVLKSNSSAIINSIDSSVIVVNGQVSFDNKTAQANDILEWKVDNFEKSSFDRSKYASDANLKALISSTKSLSSLPDELADLTPPDLKDVTPIDQSQTTNSKVTLKAQTEKGATGTINSDKLNIDDNGNISQDLTLKTGENDFAITLTDSFANSKTYNIKYFLQEDLESTCNYSNFSDKLLCLINKDRTSMGLSKLTDDPSLDSVALNHAQWMSNNSSTSSVETDGASFQDRCIKQNTTCKIEINLKEQNDADSIYQTLISDPGYKGDIETSGLSSYAAVSFGSSDIYISILFN